MQTGSLTHPADAENTPQQVNQMSLSDEHFHMEELTINKLSIYCRYDSCRFFA